MGGIDPPASLSSFRIATRVLWPRHEFAFVMQMPPLQRVLCSLLEQSPRPLGVHTGFDSPCGIFRRIALKTTTDEQMKAHGHQDRAYENNVRPTRHRVGCLDESPFP